METILMLALMFGIFYFMLIRPENKRKKAAEEMRNNMKKGEQVTTIGGLVGKVVSVTDTTVVIETSEDRVRLELSKWGVQSVLNAPVPGKKKSAKVEETVDEAIAEEPENNTVAEIAAQAEAENK